MVKGTNKPRFDDRKKVFGITTYSTYLSNIFQFLVALPKTQSDGNVKTTLCVTVGGGGGVERAEGIAMLR
jgi:hypothetical protein